MTIPKKTLALMRELDECHAKTRELSAALIMLPSPKYWTAVAAVRDAVDTLAEVNPTLAQSIGSSVEAIEADWREVARIQGEIGDCQAMIIGKTESVMQQLTSTQKGAKMANARHGKPGGSRDKHQKIRDIWASGKYTSRDICAEEEGRALDMSFSAARKALRNTPDPA